MKGGSHIDLYNIGGGVIHLINQRISQTNNMQSTLQCKKKHPQQQQQQQQETPRIICWFTIGEINIWSLLILKKPRVGFSNYC